MKKEYFAVLIVGLLILVYVLDKVATPLALPLASPYHYFNTKTMFTYSFTTTSIALKALVLLIAPPLILSLTGIQKALKGLILIVLSGLMQLYSLQSVLTNIHVIPLEWSLSLTLAGVFLLIPAVFYIIIGLTQKMSKKLTAPYTVDEESSEKSED